MRTSLSDLAVLLPAIAFALTMLSAAGRFKYNTNAAQWREAMLAAAIVCGTALVGITEILSLGRALTPGAVSVAWSLVAVGSLVFLRHRQLPGLPQTADRAALAMLMAIGGIAAVVGVTAAVAAPNNWDSMTYHLPRCVHWILNRSVAPYATHIPRQLFREPGAEYAMTNVMLLGGDRWVNLVQWCCWVGCMVTMSLITRELGGCARAQMIAALFAATLPMAILEASSTQNDLVVAFWLSCLALFAIRAARGAITPLTTGASLGLALLTKGTAYLYAAPLLLWILISLWQQRGRRMWKPALVIGIVTVGINYGHWSKTSRVFGRPIGQEGNLVNRTIDPRFWLSNAVRNAALELATPWPVWNGTVETAVAGVHRALGVGENDPRSTYPGARFGLLAVPAGESGPRTRTPTAVFLHEDHAPNPIHTIALLVAVPMLLAPQRRKRPVLLYLLAIALAYMLFSIALRWQPWHSRLHVPLFTLAAPIFALALERLADPVRLGACALLVATCVPALLENTTRPLVGVGSIFRTSRLEQYLASKPELVPSYRQAARIVEQNGWIRLGLVSGGDAGEYPLRMFLGPNCALEAVDVQNASRRLEQPANPQATIYLASPNGFLPFEPDRPPVWADGLIRIVPRARQ